MCKRVTDSFLSRDVLSRVVASEKCVVIRFFPSCSGFATLANLCVHVYSSFKVCRDSLMNWMALPDLIADEDPGRENSSCK